MNPDTRPKQHREARRKLRRRLEARGVPQHLIDRAVARLRARQDAARRAGVAANQLDAIHDETHARLSPDDRAFRPNAGDPLERGAARVSARTARAARRRKATTRYELDRQERTP